MKIFFILCSLLIINFTNGVKETGKGNPENSSSEHSTGQSVRRTKSLELYRDRERSKSPNPTTTTIAAVGEIGDSSRQQQHWTQQNPITETGKGRSGNSSSEHCPTRRSKSAHERSRGRSKSPNRTGTTIDGVGVDEVSSSGQQQHWSQQNPRPQHQRKKEIKLFGAVISEGPQDDPNTEGLKSLGTVLTLSNEDKKGKRKVIEVPDSGSSEKQKKARSSSPHTAGVSSVREPTIVGSSSVGGSRSVGVFDMTTDPDIGEIIKEIKRNLNLPDSTVDRANNLYRQFESSPHSTNVPDLKRRAIACLCIARNQENGAPTFSEYAKAANIRYKSHVSDVLEITLALRLKMVDVTVEAYVSRYCSQLNISKPIKDVATEIAKQTMRYFKSLQMYANKHHVAVTAILLASKANRGPVTKQRQLVNIGIIDRFSLSKMYLRMLEILHIVFPPNVPHFDITEIYS